MTSLADIRAALAANLATLNGLQTSAYTLSNPTLPTVWVRPNPDEFITYHEAMGNGLEFWHFVVEAYFPATSDKGAQVNLDELVKGSNTVKDAIESDTTLGGLAQNLEVSEARGYGEYARADATSALGCRWDVTVYMNGG